VEEAVVSGGIGVVDRKGRLILVTHMITSPCVWGTCGLKATVANVKEVESNR